MKPHGIFAFVTLVCLLGSLTIPVTVVTQTRSTKEDRKLAQVERGKKMSASVRRARQMLLEAGVPFEPSILFSRTWKKRVAPYLDQMPEMKRASVVGNRIKGASNISCLQVQGSNGPSGGGGQPGQHGELHGEGGPNGDSGDSDGVLNTTTSTNCGENPSGGGGSPTLEPGIPESLCTPWYWVFYHCEQVLADNSLNSYFSKFQSHHKLTLTPATDYECIEVDRQYAGCW